MGLFSRDTLLRFIAVSVMCLFEGAPVLGEGNSDPQATALDESLTAPVEGAEPPGNSEAVSQAPQPSNNDLTAKTSAETSVKTSKAPPPEAIAVTSEPLSPVAVPANAEISDGGRFAIDGKGFTMTAPAGWMVQKNLPRSSLYMQARVSGTTYPRNITVVRFKDSVLINESTAEVFAEKIVKQFPSASSTIENYALRNHQSIQMADGREGILFYTDFDGSGRKMMQAHILLSSESNHYLITYTDVVEHFENPSDGDQSFNDAWASMTSIQLDTPNPQPAKNMEMVLISILALATFVGVATSLRKVFAAKLYRKYGNLTPGEDGDAEATPEPASVSQFLSGQTQEIHAAVSGVERFHSNAEILGSADMTHNNKANDDDGIRSMFGKKILRFTQSRRDENADHDSADGSVDSSAESLEFSKETQDVQVGRKFKKGA